jgi:hypothetical protein
MSGRCRLQMNLGVLGLIENMTTARERTVPWR